MCGIVAPFNGDVVSVQYVNPSVDRSDSTTQGWWGTTRGSQKTIVFIRETLGVLKQVISLKIVHTLKIAPQWLSMVKIFESRLMRCILLTSRQWQFFKNIQVLKRFSPESDAPKFSAGPAENFGAVLGVLINTILRPNIHDWNILRTYFYKYLFIQSHYQPISIHPTNISIFPLRAVKLKHLGQGSCQGPLRGKLQNKRSL